MLTQLEVFRLVAVEFASQTDETVQSFLDIAPLFINPDLYPDESRGLALVYQAAHLMFLRGLGEQGQSNGGQLLSEKEGDLSRSFGQSDSSKRSLSSIYLQQLDALSLGVTGCGIMTRVS